MSSYCGYAAIVGRPNVGKSTLLNRLLRQKISITADKPQTTRHRILGIVTEDPYQVIWVDTPGFHDDHGKTLNRAMNKQVLQALATVDVVFLMVEVMGWREDDDRMLEQLRTLSVPVYLVLNKVDELQSHDETLPLIAAHQARFHFAGIIPISARTGDNVARLMNCATQHLPEGPHLFLADQSTDRSLHFLLAEILREKLVRSLGQELPYATHVQIESYQQEPQITRIAALIWVEREGQKTIIIGKQGNKIKKLSTQARLDMEKKLGTKVFLQVWVKVKEHWSDDQRALTEMGLNDPF